jgi:hypothetical protein
MTQTSPADASTPRSYEIHLRERLTRCQVPETLHNGLVAYIADRQKPGGFLMAVLSNDLTGAMNRADLVCRLALNTLVIFLCNYVTATCWGSPAAVEAWLADPAPAREVYE